MIFVDFPGAESWVARSNAFWVPRMLRVTRALPSGTADPIMKSIFWALEGLGSVIFRDFLGSESWEFGNNAFWARKMLRVVPYYKTYVLRLGRVDLQRFSMCGGLGGWE